MATMKENIEYELRRQLDRNYGWPDEAIDEFFALIGRDGGVGSASSLSLLKDINKAFAKVRTLYHLAEWEKNAEFVERALRANLERKSNWPPAFVTEFFDFLGHDGAPQTTRNYSYMLMDIKGATNRTVRTYSADEWR